MQPEVQQEKSRKKHHRKCPKCEMEFETIWTRQVYCSRRCYMKGVDERKKIWEKTPEGLKWRKTYSVDMHRTHRIDALRALGAKCKRCGYSDIRALHIDHVHGDGKKERGIRKTIYKQIARGEADLSRYQLLCANCNWIKRLESNEGTNWKDYNSFLLKAAAKLH